MATALVSFVTSLGMTELNTPTALLIGAVGLWVIYSLSTRKRNLPPGPRGFPIIGSLLSLSKEIHEDGYRWGQEYGDVVSFYAGNMLMVILNSYDVIKEAFVKRGEDFNDRPDLMVHRIINYEDDMLFGAYDEEFKPNKKIATMGFRNHGILSEKWLEKMETEIERSIQIIKEKSGKPFDPAVVVMRTMTVMMTSMIYGADLTQEDPKTQELADLFVRINRLESEDYAFVMEMIPAWLSKIVFKDILKEAETALGLGKKIMREEYEKHRKTLDPENPRDVMDYYVMNRSKKDQERILSTILLFLPDATETTTGLIMWVILFLMYNPDMQKKVHDELDEVVGRSEKPTMKHKSQLVYLQAVFYESLRLGNTTPSTVPHSAIKDTILKGYNIPKNAFILGNLYAAHNDPKIFPEPKKFKPERFINEDGKLMNTEYIISFGIGRRACIGETLVKAECVLYLARLYHEFEFHFSPDNPNPTLDPITFFGLFKLPRPFDVVVKERL